jgi:branched-chain amino acid transport system ATP-binding protein
VLEGRGIVHHFGGLAAVDDVDFDVAAGAIVGLIGPNGAGKTTLFNIISGAIAARRGSVRFKGKDITRARPDQISRMGMARTFQTTKLFTWMTAFDNVRLALVYGNPDRRFTYWTARREVNQIMASVGLLAERDKLAGDLPLGVRRRLEIARALATNAEMLLLDEVMAGLTESEVRHSIELIGRLRADGLTILMVEHVMQAIVEVCDRIMVLHNGRKIAEGAPEAIMLDPVVRSVYLGDD